VAKIQRGRAWHANTAAGDQDVSAVVNTSPSEFGDSESAETRMDG
jgi:hypothetical protein